MPLDPQYCTQRKHLKPMWFCVVSCHLLWFTFTKAIFNVLWKKVTGASPLRVPQMPAPPPPRPAPLPHMRNCVVNHCRVANSPPTCWALRGL